MVLHQNMVLLDWNYDSLFKRRRKNQQIAMLVLWSEHYYNVYPENLKNQYKIHGKFTFSLSFFKYTSNILQNKNKVHLRKKGKEVEEDKNIMIQAGSSMHLTHVWRKYGQTDILVFNFGCFFSISSFNSYQTPTPFTW